MTQALLDLKSSMENKLSIFYGDNVEIIKKLNNIYNFKAIYFNKDYTPYAQRRDKLIKKWCMDNSVECKTFEDYTIHPIQSVKTDKNEPYKIFTPFYNKACTLPRITNNKDKLVKFIDKLIPGKDQLKTKEILSYYTHNEKLIVKGTRENGEEILSSIGAFKTYDKTRNTPSTYTTLLGPYIKFGIVSIREVFEHFKNTNKTLLKELYWREFYANVYYNRLDQNKLQFEWNTNYEVFKSWCEGKTGFPIVDAGMRQLNTIGWMHNRLRMITASFLVKNLHIHWKKGEKYFATQLVDYDPASNNGGWQWCAGTGADAPPLFRVFNPWLQTKRFDPQCVYIKTWVHELKDVSFQDILKWNTCYKKHPNTYIKPIVDHRTTSKYFKEHVKKM